MVILMDSNIKILIDKIEINDNLKKILESATLDKIVATKTKTNYCF